MANSLLPVLGAGGLEYVEGEVIVTFKASANDGAARETLAKHGLTWTKHYDWLSQKRGQHFGLVRDKKRTTAKLVAELSKEPGIEFVETNYLRHVSAFMPNDTYFSQLWSLQNTGQIVNGVAGTPGADIKFLAAWPLARPTTNPVVVGVIDTGVELHHPDLISNLWVNPGNIAGDTYVGDVNGYDFADNVPSPQDSGFHGTHVSGTIAAMGNNAMGTIGVNFHAQIMALKCSNDGESIFTSAEISALDYAAMMKSNGVNIVALNASFGGGSSNNAEYMAIQAAGTEGIIFCNAAGNSTNNHDVTTVYPAAYRLPNMIVVAATDQNDKLASFSDYGANSVDIGAPGVNILSLAPTNVATTTPINCTVQQGTNIYAAAALEFSPGTPGVTGTMYNCGLGNPTDFPAAVSNNIAVIQRGTLNFSTKVANAMAAHAVAAVIYNNASGNFSGTLGSASNWIPAVSISQADGASLVATLPTNGTVVNVILTNLYQFLDGTSMATPHVAGAVAFAAMNFPTETVSQRISRVLTNADTDTNLQGFVIGARRLNLRRIVDTDGNGLPDWWEQQFFGQLTGTNPNADPDHDGMSNLAEFLAGTDPTNPNSNLRVVASSGPGTNVITVQLPSVTGKTYRLLRATNFLTGFNTIVATNIAATPPTNSIFDPSAPPNSVELFYRLELEQ